MNTTAYSLLPPVPIKLCHPKVCKYNSTLFVHCRSVSHPIPADRGVCWPAHDVHGAVVWTVCKSGGRLYMEGQSAVSRSVIEWLCTIQEQIFRGPKFYLNYIQWHFTKFQFMFGKGIYFLIYETSHVFKYLCKCVYCIGAYLKYCTLNYEGCTPMYTQFTHKKIKTGCFWSFSLLLHISLVFCEMNSSYTTILSGVAYKCYHEYGILHLFSINVPYKFYTFVQIPLIFDDRPLTEISQVQPTFVTLRAVWM